MIFLTYGSVIIYIYILFASTLILHSENAHFIESTDCNLRRICAKVWLKCGPLYASETQVRVPKWTDHHQVGSTQRAEHTWAILVPIQAARLFYLTTYVLIMSANAVVAAKKALRSSMKKILDSLSPNEISYQCRPFFFPAGLMLVAYRVQFSWIIHCSCCLSSCFQESSSHQLLFEHAIRRAGYKRTCSLHSQRRYMPQILYSGRTLCRL